MFVDVIEPMQTESIAATVDDVLEIAEVLLPRLKPEAGSLQASSVTFFAGVRRRVRPARP